MPEGDARAASRAARPTDLLLLALRCAALLLLGAAFAGPVTRGHGSSLARVVIADASRSGTNAVRDSVTAQLRSGDALVVLDSSAREVAAGALDSARALAPGIARGSLSSGLVAADRAAHDLARSADSVEVVIVSPITTDELDAATTSLAARWPGRVRVVRTPAAPRTNANITLVSSETDDPLRPAIAALNASVSDASASARAVRVARGKLTPADSDAARAGAAVVHWPRSSEIATKAEGISSGGAMVVATLNRLPLPPGGATVARWGDGDRAATESLLGRGCVREVGVGLPPAGDVTLQPAFVAVARELMQPCATAAVGATANDSTIHQLARSGAAATAESLRSTDARSPLAPWLLGAALLVLVFEVVARRGSAREVTA